MLGCACMCVRACTGRVRGVYGRVRACTGVHGRPGACTGMLGRACMHGRARACMHAHGRTRAFAYSGVSSLANSTGVHACTGALEQCGGVHACTGVALRAQSDFTNEKRLLCYHTEGPSPQAPLLSPKGGIYRTAPQKLSFGGKIMGPPPNPSL